MLLYIGAGSDVRPITDLPYKHFIYVDALPNKPHYRPEHSGYPFEEALVHTMETELDDSGCVIDSRVKLSPTVYRYTLNDDKVLTYAINTLDEHAHEVPEVAALLPNVSAVFLAGYAPVFNGLLPALKTIYATPIVEDMLYDEWKEQFCKRREVEWLRVYDSYRSDRDVFDKIPTMVG
jgi:hypothetical protein